MIGSLRALRFAFVFFLIAFGFAPSVQSQTAPGPTDASEVEQDFVHNTPGSIAEDAVDDLVSQTGAYTQSIPLNIPEFYGLVPGLAANYNPEFNGLRRPEVWMCVWWQLGGLSSITRVSVGYGTPFYENKRDVFLLDGAELMACDDQDATNQYSWDYPSDYKTENLSASCSSGGNMSTRVESYRKIIRSSHTYDGGPVDFFQVWDRDGTRYFYQSIGKLAGIPRDINDSDYDSNFNRLFLLTEIRNTQTTLTRVQISYQFDTRSRALAHRPHKISYPGYEIEFHYRKLDDPLATYGVGVSDLIGEQNYLLRSLTVQTDTGTKIRGWKFAFSPTTHTNRYLLQDIIPYGNDFTMSTDPENKYIDGGSTTPNLLRNVSYANEVHLYSKVEYPNDRHNYFSSAIDVDGDYRDELVNRYQLGSPSGFAPPDVSSFTNLGSVQPRNNYHSIKTNAAGGPQYNHIGVVGPLPGNQGDFWQVFGGNQWSTALNFHRLDVPTPPSPYPNNCSSQSNTCTGYQDLRIIGNFDRDPEQELFLNAGFHDIIGNRLDLLPNAGFENTQFYISTLIALPHLGAGAQDGSEAHYNFSTDLNADGIDEVLLTTCQPGASAQGIGSILQADENGEFKVVASSSTTPGTVSQHGQSCNLIASGNAPFTGQAGEVNGETFALENAIFGDFNGDGLPDRFVPVEGKVQLGDGLGFSSTKQTWAPFMTAGIRYPSFWTDFVADINNDGLDDVVVTRNNIVIQPDVTEVLPYDSVVYLSTGSTFIEAGANFHPDLSPGGPSAYVVGHGDFNGDGSPDLIRSFAEDALIAQVTSAVYFSDTGRSSTLEAFENDKGLVSEITYTPSSEFSGNKIPAVRQLVKNLKTVPGVGAASTYTFSYTSGDFDYVNRADLGFGEITVTLPSIDGETQDKTIKTTYFTDHFSSAGLVSTRKVQYGTTLYRETINSWNRVLTGNGPFRAQRDSEKVRTRHGNKIIEKTQEFEYDEHNNLTQLKDLGFAGTQDDSIVTNTYAKNTASYIVDKMTRSATKNGLSPAGLNPDSNWIYAEYMGYDGGSWQATPSIGNATKMWVWNGDLSTNGQKRMWTRTHDSRGNVLTETDARNHQTQFAYTGPGQIFLASTTNAKGHVTSNQWNQACQAPSKTTDPNGKYTDYVYDVFCRETSATMVWGPSASERFETLTSYLNFGNPTAQNIEGRQTSSNTDSGNKLARQRTYFDGAGRTYKETLPGGVSPVSASRVTLRRFDPRGNVLWESIPITWSDSQDNDTASGNKITTEYDPLDRPTSITQPDGAYMTMEYKNSNRNILGQVTDFPEIDTRGISCTSGSPGETCERQMVTFDADGNMIRDFRRNINGTDIGAGNWPHTQYVYDNLNRLTKVTDPSGNVFEYSYDSYGNLISQDDPGLGRWTMTYLNDNLLREQIDAKGQSIKFWYDSLGRETRKRVIKINDDATTTNTNIYSEYDVPSGSFANIGRLTEQRLTGPGAHQINYGYDKQGSLVSRTTSVDGKNYVWQAEYTPTGQIARETYHSTPGATTTNWTPYFTYDTADRVKSFGSYITSVTYDIWSNRTGAIFDNNVELETSYNAQRGWVTQNKYKNGSGSGNIVVATYVKSDSGRVMRQNHTSGYGDLDFTYDYRGRLLSATYFGDNTSIGPNVDQTFQYDAAGRMRFNSLEGTYNYPSATSVGGNGNSPHSHAPNSVTPTTGTPTNFTYDENGNMTDGLNEKAMAYDGENRPLSVVLYGKKT